MTKETIGLIAAGLGLLSAVVALITSLNNSRAIKQQSSEISRQSGELRQQEAKIEGLLALADKIAIELTIDAPKEGEKIATDVFDGMNGSYAGVVPSGHKLYVLARDRFNFFLMYPPPQVAHATKRWSQTNIRLATDGRWELHVCVADGAGAAWLEGRAAADDWSGFPALPSGIQSAKSVTVERVRRLTSR